MSVRKFNRKTEPNLDDMNQEQQIIYMTFQEIVDQEPEPVPPQEVRHKRMTNEEFDQVKNSMVGTCDICGGTFSDLMTHLRKHYYDKPFLCRSCNLSFKTEDELETHKNSCEEQKKLPFPCSVCMTYNCANVEHRRTQVVKQPNLLPETPVKTYKCLGCKREFNLYKQWKAHSGFCKSQSRLHKCQNCKKCYGLLILLRMHQIHCKKEQEGRFNCDHCRDVFYNKSDLVTHVLRKHKETVAITLESLLNESKQLKKNAEGSALRNIAPKPVAETKIIYI